jgi:hypothetical protein
MDDLLTDADLADIEANLSKYDRLNEKLIEVRMALKNFLRVWYKGAVPMYVRWSHRILTDLTDECYGEPLWRHDAPETITALKARWSTKVQEAWEVHLEEREDPEYGARLKAEGRFDTHPWGDAVEIGQWWLAMTPYRVWKIAEALESAAAFNAKDGIFDFIHGDGGKHFAMDMNARYDAALDELRKEFESTRETKAA